MNRLFPLFIYPLVIGIFISLPLSYSWSQSIPSEIEQETSVPENMAMHHHGMHSAPSLPNDCAAISTEVEFIVYAGTEFAADFPATVFGLSQHEYLVEPCSQVTITLINKDNIRHQWMLHGLPRYLYPQGMFHLDVAGGEQMTGSFIVPSDIKTYLIHCDMAQHMENGMKAQMLVGGGDGNLLGIPGISENYKPAVLSNKYVLGFLSIFIVAVFTFHGFVIQRRFLK